MNDKNSGVSTPPDWAIRELIRAEIKRSDKKRPQIALEMAALTGTPVTEHMLNDFTSKSKSGARFPAAFVKAFCEVVGSSSLQRFLDDREALEFIEIGKQATHCKNLLDHIVSLVEKLTDPDSAQMHDAIVRKGKKR